MDLAVLILFLAALPLNEGIALSAGMEAGSMAEFKMHQRMMAELSESAELKSQLRMNTSLNSALTTFQSMHLGAASKLTAMVQETFGAQVQGRAQMQQRSNLRQAARLDALEEVTPTTSLPTGYAAVEPAINEINKMIDETQRKKDIGVQACTEYATGAENEMEILRLAVTEANKEAARARAVILKSQKDIDRIELNELPAANQELKETKEQCENMKNSIRTKIGIVTHDMKVMEGVLDMVVCDSTAAGGIAVTTTAAAASFLQLGMETKEALRKKQECDECKQQSKYSLIDRLGVLKQGEVSAKVKAIVKEELGMDADLDQEPGSWKPVVANTSDVPEEPVKPICKWSGECTLANSPLCEPLRNRFLAINAGLQELKSNLENELARVEAKCEKDIKNIEDTISALETSLKEAEEDLAQGTAQMNEASELSHLRAGDHARLLKEYYSRTKKCCKDRNTALTEICALEKIRGELLKMQGMNVFIEDCEVSKWYPQECPVTCGGGIQDVLRVITVHPVRGAPCPPLKMEQACNVQPCPVNCEVGTWSSWSECDAKCGGGVKSKVRPIKVAPAHGGTPCPPTSTTASCNTQACNRNCILNRWSGWTSCSRSCNTGRHRRIRTVKHAAIGQGTCPGRWSSRRVQYRKCNQFSCQQLIYYNNYARKVYGCLDCKSNVDVTLLVDGSGSLGTYGWAVEVLAVSRLIDALTNLNAYSSADPEKGARASLMVFSGPTYWRDYYRCIGYWSYHMNQWYLANRCGLDWRNKFRDNKSPSDQITDLRTMTFPRKTTFTSGALYEARAEQVNTRPDTNKVVIVFTDGHPMNAHRTYWGSHAVRRTGAKLMYVPVGHYARWGMRLMRRMASHPYQENVIAVRYFWWLYQPWMLNQIIGNICPHVS